LQYNESNSKIAIKFENKQRESATQEICKKQAQKTSNFEIKQAEKEATRKSSKKTQIQINKPKINSRKNRKVVNTLLTARPMLLQSKPTTSTFIHRGHTLDQKLPHNFSFTADHFCQVWGRGLLLGVN